MCEQCLAAIKKYYPDLPESDYGVLLMNATAYPFGCGKTVERQLKETSEATDGSLGQAIGYAERKMDEEWKKYKSRPPEEER
jgi:hypothetical protein